MIELHLIETAAALGFYVLFAGCYAIAYASARLLKSRALFAAAAMAYALHVLLGTAIIALSPLAVGWKMLLAASSLAILAIPVFTWRFLERTHAEGIRA